MTCGRERPNLLFILTDQLRWDGLGRTGDWVRTAHLDRLADEGMLFRQCVTNPPVCVPARVSLATGLYPHQTGIWGNEEYDLPPESGTWMRAIRDAGYFTGLIGKTHLHRHNGDLRDREHLLHAYGFDHVDEIGGPRASMRVGSHMTDEWQKAGLLETYIEDYKERYASKPFAARPSVLPLELYADVYVGSRAKAFIRERQGGDRPWFCMISFGGPHEPWDAPEPYASMYDPARMPKPIPRPAADGLRPRGVLDRLMADPVHSPEMTERDIAAMRANYAGNVTLIDEQIGGLLGVLEETGMLDHTAIVFSSDHGEMNGDYGLIYKENMLNGAVRVPLLIRTPGMKRSGTAGSVCEAMVELFDVGPTLCELAGAEMRHPQCAKSLIPLLNDPEAAHREEALVEVHGEIMLQSREWKLVLNAEGEPYLLFHLQEDPDELTNRVNNPECARVIGRLQEKIADRLERTRAVQP